MKKKLIIALLLAGALSIGAAFGGCEVISGGNNGKPSGSETQKPDDSETQKPDDSETQKPDEGETQKPDDGETQKPDDGETQKPDDGETQKPNEGETQKPNEGETQKPNEGETQKPSDEQPQKPSEEQPQQPSDEQPQKPSDEQPQKPSDEQPQQPDVTVTDGITYAYAGNECAAFEWEEKSPSSAKVEYRAEGESAFKTVDSALIRGISDSVARVDAVGLKGGVKYEFKITTSQKKVLTATDVAVTSYDRSGYAHFNYSSGVGAYNDDGTLKSNAVVIYVSEQNKNTVKATFGGKEYTGIVPILGALSKSSVPVVVRVIGTVGAATWNKLDYNESKQYNSQNLLPLDKVVGKNGKQLPQASKITQAELISGGYNTLNTSVYSELIGLDSRAKFTGKEYDTIWNNCPVSDAQNVTLEGIGEDARIFQWGITWSNCNSIEVRNLTFEDYTEDACSFEGSQTSATSLASFKSKNFWVHHNTFEEGINYWDLCSEQDKHDGDGSTDIKGVSNVTFSYNVYHECHKTGLVGGGDAQTTANVTFHHNYYNKCSSRLPLARQANMHMYNNYYSGTTSTCLSIRANAYAFVENCYFDTGSRCTEIQIVNSGDNGMGAVKVINSVYNAKKVSNQTGQDSRFYSGNDRLARVASSNVFANAFDTNEALFYFDASNSATKVTSMLATSDVPTVIPKVAGVQIRGGNAGLGGNASGAVSGGTSQSGGTQSTPAVSVDMGKIYSQLLERATFKEDFSSVAEGTIFPAIENYGAAGIYSLPDSKLGIEQSYTYVSGGQTSQATNGANTTTVISLGSVANKAEGYFRMSTSDVGSKWDLIRFISGNKIVAAVRIDTDKKLPLTYYTSQSTAAACTTPSSSFVWAAETQYAVYFSADVETSKLYIKIAGGGEEFEAEINVELAGICGIQLISSSSGARITSVDNVALATS